MNYGESAKDHVSQCIGSDMRPHRWKGQITSSEKESTDHVIQQQKKAFLMKKLDIKARTDQDGR